MKLIWTESAAEQVEGIYTFIKKISEVAAIAIYNDILDEADRLLLFPKMGLLEPLLSELADRS